MLDAKLKFGERELIIDKDVITIGRVPDNDVSFPDDSNVSRYHAEIEVRGGDAWLIDLNSSNGTTVNGNRVSGEARLEFGDKLLFGGSSEAEFLSGEAKDDESEPPEIEGLDDARSELGSLGSEAGSALEDAAGEMAHGHAPATQAELEAAATAGSSATILIAGAVVGIAIVCAVAAGAYYATRGSACDARASITKPETGDTISAPVEIQIDTKNAGCIQGAIFTIDGKDVAAAESPSFTATLDPKNVPELADGVDHSLQVVLIDTAGQKIAQAGAIMLAFETRAIAKATPTPGSAAPTPVPGKRSGGGQPSLVQINDMTQKLVKQLSGNFTYNLTNRQFLQEIQKRSAEYVQDGYWQRAAAFRDTINVAFVREQNIDASFAFILAMSRSKFNAVKQYDLEGLWQMSNAFVAENKYNGQCGAETLSDPSQNCAAKAAALYLKAVIFNVFDGDLIYSAAAFGKSPQDAAAWKAALPKDHSDVGNSVRTPAEREQIVRFFAAGIVSENPQAFGLAKDRPLSDLYKVTL